MRYPPTSFSLGLMFIDAIDQMYTAKSCCIVEYFRGKYRNNEQPSLPPTPSKPAAHPPHRNTLHYHYEHLLSTLPSRVDSVRSDYVHVTTYISCQLYSSLDTHLGLEVGHTFESLPLQLQEHILRGPYVEVMHAPQDVRDVLWLK